MEVDEYAHEAEERIEESFREHFIYALQVAVVIYVSTILVFGTECFRVFIRYCPMIWNVDIFTSVKGECQNLK